MSNRSRQVLRDFADLRPIEKRKNDRIARDIVDNYFLNPLGLANPSALGDLIDAIAAALNEKTSFRHSHGAADQNLP